MILETIKNKLLEVDPNVFYGMVDNSVRESVWDYIVFSRDPTKVSANKTGYSYYFMVTIVRENFIPEGLDRAVIDKMLEIDGMRLAGTDMPYYYERKPNTNIVVEMLSIVFVKAVKA